jgi:hypothetical protein
VLIANAGQSAVFAELVIVHGVHNDSAQPSWFRRMLGHASLRQRSQGVSILLGDFGGHLQRALGVWIVGRQEDPTIGFDG